MKYEKAIKIARQCIEAEIKKLAPQANLVEFYKADAPSAVNAHERRKELRDALQALGQGVLKI